MRVVGALGAFERARIEERTRHGTELARSHGQVLGASRALPSGRDEDLRGAAERGQSVAQIAAKLGVGRNTVLRRLRQLGLWEARRPCRAPANR